MHAACKAHCDRSEWAARELFHLQTLIQRLEAAYEQHGDPDALHWLGCIEYTKHLLSEIGTESSAYAESTYGESSPSSAAEVPTSSHSATAPADTAPVDSALVGMQTD